MVTLWLDLKSNMLSSLQVAFFLAVRYLMRTSLWQTLLVVFVMMLTFLNLVVVTGLLVGLIDGSLKGYNERYAGDILISKFPEKQYIERSTAIRAILAGEPGIAGYSERLVESGSLEANFQRSVAESNVLPDKIGVSIAGITVREEARVTNIENYLVEGEFITDFDDDQIVMGANLLDRYFPSEIGLQTVSDVYVGDKVRITIGNAAKDYLLKGVVKTKADATDLRVFLPANELRRLINRSDYNVDEFAVRLLPGENIDLVKRSLIAQGAGDYALVRTTEEAVGEFLDEIKDTFSFLGNIIGAISVIVASITIFIIIFITAITRQKYIGILKAIGVTGATIELSYVMLSLFYAVVGIGVGLTMLYVFILPYFNANPIDFPFSDGMLSVTANGTFIRASILMITTIIAGYMPAKIIVRKNALDAILGR